MRAWPLAMSWQGEANGLDGEMDTKPRNTEPADLDLELAVFGAP